MFTDSGNWKMAQGTRKTIFKAFEKEFKSLPIIAEDLGEITPDVVEFKRDLSPAWHEGAAICFFY
jgi:4-alpha-glucanotransferase